MTLALVANAVEFSSCCKVASTTIFVLHKKRKQIRTGSFQLFWFQVCNCKYNRDPKMIYVLDFPYRFV